MSLRRRPINDIAAEVERLGGLVIASRHGGKHPYLIAEIKGVRHRITCPFSPSDWRSPLNARAQVRRLFTRIGPTGTRAARQDGGALSATEPPSCRHSTERGN